MDVFAATLSGESALIRVGGQLWNCVYRCNMSFLSIHILFSLLALMRLSLHEIVVVTTTCSSKAYIRTDKVLKGEGGSG